MKNIFRIMTFPVLAVVIMLLTQVVVSVMVVMGCIVASGQLISEEMEIPTVSSDILSLALLLSSIVTIIIILLIKQYGLRNAFYKLGSDALGALMAFCGILFGTFASNLLTELFNLPNSMEAEFLGMSQSVLGIISIGIVGPICEELVFRGGVMRPMLSNGVNPWVVVMISAAVFGIIHWNPIQIPFAMMIGIMYGIVYLRTGSLIITTICHIINNTSSVLMMNSMGAKSMESTFQDEFGLPLTITVTIVSIILCVFFLRLFWLRTEPKSYAPSTVAAY